MMETLIQLVFFKQQRQGKGNKKSSSSFNSHKNKSNECDNINPNMCFRCGSEDHYIADYTRPEILENKVF